MGLQPEFLKVKGPRLVVRNPKLLWSLRSGKGMSREGLALLVGVSAQTIANWELGRVGGDRGIPKRKADRLLHALSLDTDPARSCPVGEWVGLDEAETPPKWHDVR